ncbi:sensor domain-containing diguanylate cyclase [Marinobacter sp. AL4B]|uniref:sensor domain-containing diguanylate cyclase n=1 Tax=Marinobacter sp. AL4B TaxID=2871173 RepID=UPI001CAA6C84|nr:sensor domain-containing diguanylate cyclase [Marinobacter sp. AL4B]MBZ0335142.1 sensor domain-containing diguanylate cyclase [Marinobacter sp. AL4B]
MLLRATAEISFNSIVITDKQHNIVYANPAFCRMTGYSLDELRGQNPRILQGPLTDPQVIEKLRHGLEDRGFFSGSTINYRKNGKPYLLEWTITEISDDADEPRFFLSVQKDITQLDAEQTTGNLFAKAIDAAYDGIFITDAEGLIEFANQGFEIITGYTPAEVIGHTPSILKSGKHDEAFYERLWRYLHEGLPFRAMVINRHKDGREIHCQQTITAVKRANGTISHYVSIIKDMTDRVFDELKLREQASHDAMTGLLNRRGGELELEVSLIQCEETSSTYCIVMADIDNFKAVNDTYGHPRGDEIIKAVADILIENTRKSDKCIRWGGEEFIVLLPFCDMDRATRIAENIRTDLAAMTFEEIGGVTLSLGVTDYTSDDTPKTILERVDHLLYQSKRTGKNRVSSEQIA